MEGGVKNGIYLYRSYKGTTMDRTNKDIKRIATIGGTFDTLHQGHKDYIKLSFDFAHYVIIYIKTDAYVSGKKSYQVRPYQERYAKLAEFVRQIGVEDKCEIRPHGNANDFISAYLNEFIQHDVLYMAMVSPEYYEKFLAISRLRESKDMSSILLIVKSRLCDGKNDLSSSAIRCLERESVPSASSLTSNE
jgi:cytidyltransferase-like protein